MSTSRISSQPSNSLRPRAPRLISGLSDTDEDAIVSASPPQSPTHIRHRPTSQPSQAARNTSASSQTRLPRPGTKPNAPTFASLWGSSWNAIQGIANDFLGEQAPEEHDPHGRRQSKPLFIKPRTDSWGPKQAPAATTASYIATGSSAEREALVRAQKRKAMLSGAIATYPDASGKFKRRTSDEGVSNSAPPGGNDNRDALVYLHHVAPEDTLAGITIRYSCQANVLRRANRMWPNDTVQVRKVLVLPVDACGVKGRPISSDQADLLIDPDKDESDLPTPKPNGVSLHRRTGSVTSNTSHASESDPPWTHDSWVVFPTSVAPTEIVRLSRRALGYFPPARRKSQSYSDLDTPNGSLDISRSGYFDSLSATASASQSPLRQDAPQRPRRPRRTSNATNGYFPSYLAGPGGVGTMAKNVKAPGPAQDGLNRLFASKLPNVAPPPNQQNLYMPDVPRYEDYPSGASSPYPHGNGSGINTPTGQGLNLEHMGAAVEGWIKKMAVRAQKGLEGNDATHGSGSKSTKGPPGIGGPSGIGDLIEMADNFEIGSDEDRQTHNNSRGRQTQGSGASFATTTAKSRGKAAKAD